MSTAQTDLGGAAGAGRDAHAGSAPDHRARRGARVRTGQAILVALFAVAAVFAVSVLFADDPFPASATVLIASFGALSAVLGVIAVIGGLGSRVVRIGLWAFPLFFVWHVAALGTWVPDAAFAVVSAVGVALVSGPPAQRPRRA
ncbi:hypothetical protein [Agromyces binzhouensis]|uniref:hypothetical protein n=1 Tax=Agromyces binzhouensis TaxID=1817495 RepID=UPI0013EA5D75|nr:hypothetical protein [Agromyces binzhouensis]